MANFRKIEKGKNFLTSIFDFSTTFGTNAMLLLADELFKDCKDNSSILDNSFNFTTFSLDIKYFLKKGSKSSNLKFSLCQDKSWKEKDWKIIYHADINQRKIGITILSSDEADFIAKKIIRDKKKVILQ